MSMIRWVVILIWLTLVVAAARWVPQVAVKHSYDDLFTSEATAVLKDRPGLIIDVFALPDSAAANLVNNFLAPLLAQLQNTQVNYIDMQENPQLVAAYGINKQGEMVVRQGDDEFQLSTLSYEAFFNGLKRLSQNNDQWAVMLDGWGGKSFDTDDSNSFRQWLKSLKASSYQAVVLEWKAGMRLPETAKLIVLPAPEQTLTAEQVDWLEQQIKHGKSVWWLTDPQLTVQQPTLALLFDVMRTESFHAGQLILKSYPEHPINRSFDRPLDLVDVLPFTTQGQPLWVNEQGQTLAATQELGNSRLLVTGDSDFLSNAFLHSGGNLEMSFRMIDWLLHNDQRIDLPSLGSAQSQIHLSRFEILLFAGLMLILLPLLLAASGCYHWYKQK